MNHNEIWLVAVTAGRWQQNGIREAQAAGLKVLAIDADPNAEGFADADEVLNRDFPLGRMRSIRPFHPSFALAQLT